MKTTTKVLGGILLGSALAGAAYLLTSRKQTTFKSLGKKSKAYKRYVKEAVNDYMGQAKDKYNSKVDVYAKNGKSSIDSLKESIKI